MIYTQPQWSKLFLQMTAIDCIDGSHDKLREYRIWGDSLHELIEFAQDHTPGIVLSEKPRVMEYLIWNGVPSPKKSAIYKWIYQPTIPQNENVETINQQ